MTVIGKSRAAAWAALLMALLAVSPAPWAAPDKGLDLDEPAPAPRDGSRAETIKNPHGTACGDCHRTAQGPEAGPLLTGDDVDRLCLGCHPDSNIHPIGMSVIGLKDAPGPVTLPLGKGAHEGEVSCLSCHYLHAPAYRRHLLRGDTDVVRGRRETLCSSCHGSSLISKSPHISVGGSCHLCHMSPPKKGEFTTESLSPRVQASCNFCHSALEDQHYLEVNPFSDVDIVSQTANLGVPLLNERFTCVSCHNPHAPAGRKKLLRDVYLGLASFSTKINPHWKNVLCVTCHEGEPSSGNPSLRDGGDLNLICNRCHLGRNSRHEIHPINNSPSSYVTIPPDMPLRDGRLNCETCHDSSLQEGGEKALTVRRKNPNFLRGGFESRTEFCFRCHRQEHFRALNPHRQLDDKGRIMEVSCLFCHSSIPEPGRRGLDYARVDEETLTSVCLWCHPASYKESHPMAPHLVVPSPATMELLETAPRRIGVEFPLFEGRIVCATCHNPHQEGAIEAERGAGNKRLRLTVGQEICVGCHPAR